jgi:nicotinamidase-related amidase
MNQQAMNQRAMNQQAMNQHLLLIDPQNDFCDFPAAALPVPPGNREPLRPALPVPGAHADMLRLAAFIRRVGAAFTQIHVTLDSHHPVHIANPTWWVDAAGVAPAPFTSISVDDVRSGRWRARNPQWQPHSIAYVQKLADSGRYTLVVWPEHCLIGHWGHNVHPAVAAELDAWARERLAVIDYVPKGSNPNTEHYSAVRAEVADPADAGSQLNMRLIGALAGAERVVIAGEALSHCVANTVRDIAANWPAADVRKLVLLTDCTSSVSGFEPLGDAFVRELTARGMQTVRSSDFVVAERAV